MPRFNWEWRTKSVGGETVKFREPTSRKKRGKSKGGKKKGKGSKKGRARASSRTRRLSSSRITNPARMLSASSTIPRGGGRGRKKKRGTSQLVLIA